MEMMEIVRLRSLPCLACLISAAWLTGCASQPPIGADRVTTQLAYAQVEEHALRDGKPSSDSISILHRFDLDKVAVDHPDQVVRRLHEMAVATGERKLLFALSEMSYVAGDRIRANVTPFETRDARQFYLGSAVYAYLYLFGEGREPRPDAYDRRFRAACDFYNLGLALGLAEERITNAVVRLPAGRRKLPVGEIELQVSPMDPTIAPDQFEQIVMADQFFVRGLSTRNRTAGVGAPLIMVGAFNPALGARRCSPATAFLRVTGSLADVHAGKVSGAVELHSVYGETAVMIGNERVPLEVDLTVHAAYSLNQTDVWSLGKLNFFAPSKHVQSQLVMLQPYSPGRIPLVLVPGTFASPIVWAEMINSLNADPVLRRRYQFWTFMYGTGNPVLLSAAELRSALTDTVKKLDPDGKDPALGQMLVMGHSQGGLLTKLIVTKTDDRLWRLFSNKPLSEMNVSDLERTQLQRLLFVEPLPFVKRVVFMSTPHHGSYLSTSLTRRLGRWLTVLPRQITALGRDALSQTGDSETAKFLQGRIPTSLDAMSPDNPGLLAIAEIPVAPGVKAHSIIPVVDPADFKNSADGVVKYQSAHVPYVESEFVVPGGHSCQNLPATIEEVKRILHEHLNQLPNP